MSTINDDKSQLLIIILDGWTKENFNSLLNDGCLPEIEKIINDGIKLDCVISNLPSISISSHLSILSGTTISEHLIPGHRWLDRKNKRIIKYLNPFVSKRLKNDISNNITLVYEKNMYRKTIAIQEVVNRGASKIRYFISLSSKKIFKETAKTLYKNPGSVVVSWLPKVDSLSHSFGPKSERVKYEMIQTSKNLGVFLETLKENGLYDGLNIMLISDHGQREVKKRAKLQLIFKRIGLKAKLNPSIYNPKKQLIFTSGDSYAQIYLTTDMLNKRYEIAQKLSGFEEIELICWNHNGKWNILNGYGYSTAEWSDKENSIIKYNIIQGDPLEMQLKDTINYFDTSSPKHLESKYPDFLHQLMVSFIEERTGDMIIYSSYNYHFGSAPRIAFRLGFHRGTHGGPFKDEMIIPAVLKADNIKNEPIRIADILKIFTKE